MTWPVVPLGDVAETTLGKMLDKGKPKGYPHVPYLRNVNVQWGRIDTHDLLTMELGDGERERFSVLEGDLLVCEGGEIGRSAIWRGRTEYLAYQKALHRVRPSDALDTRFLRYLLEHYSQNGMLASHSTGTTIAHLPQQKLRRIPVPLPALDEQRRIVDLLEDHLSRLDGAERELRSARVKQDLVWLSTLSSLRRELLDESQAPVGDIAATSLGKMLDAKRQTGTPTRYLRNINVRWGAFDLSEVKLTPLTDADVARFDVRAGDVLVCEGGEPGRCAVWRGTADIAFQKALHRIRVHVESEMLPEFLALMLTEAIRSGRCDGLFTGTTIRHLPQEKLRTIEIPTPSLDRQRDALARAEDVTSGQARLGIAIDRGLLRVSALRRSLLAAAFTGRLTANASNVSAAEEMMNA